MPHDDSLTIRCGIRKLPGYENNLDAYAVSESENVDVATSLNLVDDVGGADAVRRVVIELNYVSNPFPGFKAVIDRLGEVACNWEKVQTLDVEMRPDIGHSNSHHASVADHATDIIEVGDALAMMFSEASKLKLSGTCVNPIATALYGRLSGWYTDQLQELCSIYPVVLAHDRPFTQLRNVSIQGEGIPGYQPPHMATGSLESLTLDGFYNYHSWASFAPDGDSRIVEFPKLTGLSVRYRPLTYSRDSTEQPLDESPWILKMPMLKKLSIWSKNARCPLLEHAELPSSVDSITISAGPELYKYIASLSLPATRRLDLHMISSSRGDHSVLVAINHILSKMRGCEEKVLNLMDDTLPVSPDDLTGTDLTRLTVSAPTSINTMLDFISKLPNLSYLALTNLTLNDIQLDISIPECKVHGPMTPLETKIHTLNIGFSHKQFSPDLAVPLAKYLLLRMPTLRCFYAGQIPEQSMAGFADEYVQWYPHLKNVSLNRTHNGQATGYIL